MSNLNNTLIICRDLKSVRKLSGFKPDAQSRYILASDDPRVQELAKEYSWIDEICWIEQMESFYNVADDVIRLTETVNEWLKSLADDKYGFSEKLLFFTLHVEGGMTTQRIQDLLLLVRSYHFIFDTYKITNIIVVSRPGIGWEDNVLIETARSRDVDVQVIGCYVFGVLIEKAKSFLKIYARAAYYAVNVFRINLSSRFKSKNTKATDREVIFQLCSSAYKHVENIVPLMKALKDKGYNPVALCWHSNEKYTKDPGATQIRREGLQVEQLEKWCSFSDMWRSIFGVFWTWQKAKRKKREFLLYQALNYRSVPLGFLLWPSVRFFIVAELAQSYRLRQALKKYFIIHQPIVIKLWGATELREGYLAWKSLPVEKEPLLFEYWIGAAIEWPYRVIDSPVDVFFVAGNHHKKIMIENRGWPNEKVKVTGQARYEQITGFKKKHSPSQSLLYLKIPDRFSTYILYDSGMLLRGFMSSQEQAITLNALLEFASIHPSVALLIKPHPGHKEGVLENAIGYCSLENVFLIHNKMLPYHALNASDLLITKFSTLGIEAMQFGRLVVCCILDREKRFNIYSDISYPAYCIRDLNKWLESFVENKKFRTECERKQKSAQNAFLCQYFADLHGTSPSVSQANILIDLIQQ